MTALTDWVLRHRRWVALAWLLVAVAGALAAPRAVDRLSYDFALPGQPAYEANVEIAERFGGGGVDDPLLLVVQGEDARTAVGDVAAQAQEAVPGTRVVTPDSPGAEVLAPEGDDVAVAVLYPPVTAGPDSYAGALPRLEQVVEAAQADGTDVELTGFALLSEGGAEGDRSVLAEVLLGGVGALVVLALVFGSLLAGVPLAGRRGLDPRHVPRAAGADLPDRRGVRGAVPRRPDRPRCRHRLLPAGGHPVARGAGRRARQRRRGAPRDGDGGSQRGLQRLHGRGVPRRPGAGAAAVPAQHRLRRAAHPAAQRGHGRHARAGPPERRRTTADVAAPGCAGPSEPRVGRHREDRRAPSVAHDRGHLRGAPRAGATPCSG